MTKNIEKSKSFCETDYFNCSVMSKGRQIICFSISGLKSVADLFRYVMTLIPEVKGLLTLNLRNMSQGWSNRYPLCLR